MSKINPTKRQRVAKKVVKLRGKKGKGVGKLTSGSNIIRIERRRKAIALRRDGWEYEEIAKELKVTADTVKEDVRYCLNMAANEMADSADEERELQKARLNLMLTPNLRFATQPHKEIVVDARTGAQHIVEKPPDPAYANVVLKIEERRSKLLALDKPEVKKLEVSGVRLYPGVNTDDV